MKIETIIDRLILLTDEDAVQWDYSSCFGGLILGKDLISISPSFFGIGFELDLNYKTIVSWSCWSGLRRLYHAIKQQAQRTKQIRHHCQTNRVDQTINQIYQGLLTEVEIYNI